MNIWESKPPPKTRIETELNWIDRFDARGMRLVYGRGDRILLRGRWIVFKMDIWRDRNGSLFARFWSRSTKVDNCWLSIHGIPPDSIPVSSREGSTDAWIPQTIRREFETWLEQAMEDYVEFTR